MQEISIIELAKKYKEGTATSEENELLRQWQLLLQLDKSMLLDEEELKQKVDLVWLSIAPKLANLEQKPALVVGKRVIFSSRLKYAAAIILLLACGAFFWINYRSGKLPGSIVVRHMPDAGVAPGGNKAILTLSNGRQVVLADGNEVLNDGAVRIDKRNGELIYSKSDVIAVNTMSTPRGGQYRLTLPDGSLVWLNAASSITYPTSFPGGERNVSITGEAYFEVAHEENKPFHVSVNGLKVEVLGTHFNINSYEDESSLSATLLEGSVRIIKDDIIKIIAPGEQAQLTAGNELIVKSHIDVEHVVAWKNGYFQFSQTDIQTVMRQLARWYDVQVVYNGEAFKQTFYGAMPRSLSISSILKILEEAGGIHFKIEGKKIIVTS